MAVFMTFVLQTLVELVLTSCAGKLFFFAALVSRKFLDVSCLLY